MMAGCAMCFGGASVSYADEAIGNKADNFWYIEYGNEAILSGYEGTDSEVFIPDEIEGYKITSIYQGLFKDNTEITSVSLPAAISEIRESAFENCTNLTEVIFRSDENKAEYLKIEEAAFKNSGIEGFLDLPDNLTELGRQAFANCTAITQVTIKDKLKSTLLTGEEAFMGCTSLLTVELENGVDGVSKGMFSGCVKLNSVHLPDSAADIYAEAFKNCSEIRSVDSDKFELPPGLGSIGDSAFMNCDGFEVLTIPDGVTTIGKSAFEGCDNLVTVDWPANLYNIDDAAFKDCIKINTVRLPDSVTLIGQRAFMGCSELSLIYIPRTVDNCGSDMLKDCSDNLVIETTADESGAVMSYSNVEQYAKENNIRIEYSDAAAEDEVYEDEYGNSWRYRINADETAIITKYIIPDNPKDRIDSEATLIIPDKVAAEDGVEYTVNEIGSFAFERLICGKVIVPDTVKAIGVGAFSNGAMHKICIPKSVESMDAAVFTGSLGTKVYTKVGAANVISYLTENKIDFVTVIENITIPDKFTFSSYYGSATLPVTISPESATDKLDPLGWKSDNEDVVLVVGSDNTAGLSSMGTGTATVTVTYRNELEDVDIVASCIVTVTDEVPADPESTDSDSTDQGQTPTSTDSENPGQTSTDSKTTQDPAVTPTTTPTTTPTDKGSDSSEKQSNIVVKPVVGKVSTFKINNKTKNKLKLTWKKMSGAAGYEIQYSTSKKYKKATKVKVSKSKKAYTIKKLKSGKKYYVRIRAYKTYKDASGKKQTVYGKWVAKNVKCK